MCIILFKRLLCATRSSITIEYEKHVNSSRSHDFQRLMRPFQRSRPTGCSPPYHILQPQRDKYFWWRHVTTTFAFSDKELVLWYPNVIFHVPHLTQITRSVFRYAHAIPCPKQTMSNRRCLESTACLPDTHVGDKHLIINRRYNGRAELNCLQLPTATSFFRFFTHKASRNKDTRVLCKRLCVSARTFGQNNAVSLIKKRA